jgi:FemAB-related protein (PEP-CTERM system-associated)
VSHEITTLGVDTVEWDAFVRASDDGTPFHLSAWKRAVEETYGQRSHYLMARRGGALEGVLPLFEVRGITGEKALVSIPYAVYGGVCATSPETARALVDAATELGRRRGAAYVELRQRRDLGLGLPVKSLYVTFSRPISPDEEENAKAIPRKQRRMTRQGAKYGMRASIGHEYLDRFYEIYAESLHRLGTPVFPKRLMQAIAKHYDKECEVLAVWHDERIVAGVLSLYFEGQVLPYYGAVMRLPNVPGVAHYMYWELMCHAAKRGDRVFDFGRSREGTGAYEFKRHWGFEPVPLPYQYVLLRRRELPDLNPSNPKTKRLTETWKKLPLAVTNRLGPVLTRWLA